MARVRVVVVVINLEIKHSTFELESITAGEKYHSAKKEEKIKKRLRRFARNAFLSVHWYDPIG